MRRVSLMWLALLLVVPSDMLRAQAPRADAPAPPKPGPPPTDAQVAADVTRLVAAWGDLGWFSGAMLVARGDTVLGRAAAGMANPEFNSPATVDTLFRITSITQLFTAAAILKLQEQGKLRVDDPIGALVPEWPEAFRGITVKQLLTGRSGLKDVSQMTAFVNSVPLQRTSAQLVDAVFSEPPVGPADTSPRAPNSSYHLLAALIEKVSGVPYAEYLKREITGPLGLAHTQHDDPSAIIPGRAVGLNLTSGTLKIAPWFHMDNALGMADLISTVGDVHRFFRALVGGRIISKDSLAQLTTAHIPGIALPNGRTAPGFGYGLAIASEPALWTTAGSINGANTTLQYSPDDDTLVVVLSNIGNSGAPNAMVRAITADLKGQPLYVPKKRIMTAPRPQDLQAVAGTWDVPNAFVITPNGRQPLQMIVRVEGSRVFVKTAGFGSEAEWFSEGPGRFFNPNSDAQIVVGEDGPDQAQSWVQGLKQIIKKVAG